MLRKAPQFILRRHGHGVTFVRHASKHFLLSGDESGTVIVWNVLSREPVFYSSKSWTTQSRNAIKAIEVFEPGHAQCLENVLVQKFSGDLQLWNVTRAQKIAETSTQSSSMCRLTLLRSGAAALGFSSQGLFYMMASKDQNTVSLYDMKRSPLSFPLLKTKALEHQRILGFPEGREATTASPGWITGIQSVAAIGPTYILVSYEAFGVQALYDLRNPGALVSNPVAVSRRPEITVEKDFDLHGNLEKKNIPFDKNYGMMLKDPLEYKKEVLECKRSQCKLGIGDIVLTSHGQLALIGGWDGNWHCLDTVTYKCQSTIEYHSAAISCLDVNEWTQSMAVASYDSCISFWRPFWEESKPDCDV